MSRTARWVVVLGACVVALGATGCKKHPASTPNEAFLSFVRALERDERKVVLSSLSQKTRQALEAKAQEVQKAEYSGVR